MMMTLIVDYEHTQDKKKFLKENKDALVGFDKVIYVNNRSVQGTNITLIESK